MLFLTTAGETVNKWNRRVTKNPKCEKMQPSNRYIAQVLVDYISIFRVITGLGLKKRTPRLRNLNRLSPSFSPTAHASRAQRSLHHILYLYAHS